MPKSFGMGALPSPHDPRNINISRVQRPVPIPDLYITDISMLGVNDQGNEPRCVGESFCKIAEYYVYKKTRMYQAIPVCHPLICIAYII